ncbi:MAG: response regulator [Treponemataceae bacterium]
MSTILIVDDEPSILEVTSAILERQGFQTIKAENAEDAEKVLVKGGIDAMVVDVVLPGRGGIDILMGLREHNSKIPVIVMSGKVRTGSDPFRLLAIQFGAKCILAKPFTGDELVAAVKAVLGESCEQAG